MAGDATMLHPKTQFHGTGGDTNKWLVGDNSGPRVLCARERSRCTMYRGEIINDVKGLACGLF